MRVLTMYMGDPHNVAAIMLLWRYRANPKSATDKGREKNTCFKTSSKCSPAKHNTRSTLEHLILVFNSLHVSGCSTYHKSKVGNNEQECHCSKLDMNECEILPH